MEQPTVVEEVTNEVGDAMEGVGEETEGGAIAEGVDETWETPEEFVDDSGIIGGEQPPAETPDDTEVVIPPVDAGDGAFVDDGGAGAETVPAEGGVIDETMPQ